MAGLSYAVTDSVLAGAGARDDGAGTDDVDGADDVDVCPDGCAPAVCSRPLPELLQAARQAAAATATAATWIFVSMRVPPRTWCSCREGHPGGVPGAWARRPGSAGQSRRADQPAR